MTDRQPLKRRRIVTACAECHRRKQKCDRTKPCSRCTRRNITSKCIYTDIDPSLPSTSLDDDSMGDASKPISETNIIETEPEEIADFGYSSTSLDSAFGGLKQLLNSNKVEQVPTPKQSVALLNHSTDKITALIRLLPSKAVIQDLVAVFFKDVNWHSNIVEPVYFDDLLSNWNTSRPSITKHLDKRDLCRELKYFPALLFQVLAMVLQFLPPNSPVFEALLIKDMETCDRRSQEYSDASMDVMAKLGRHNTALTAVQTDLLRASWLKNAGHGIESWHSLGNAIRQAQELGLHQHSDIFQDEANLVGETLSLMWYYEYRRRVWVNVVNWDGLMAMILGRPRTIHTNDCNIKTPLDCNIPEDPSTTVPMDIPWTSASYRPTSYSVQLYAYGLVHKVHELKDLGADQRTLRDYSIVTTLHDQVISLLDNVPHILRPYNPDRSWDIQYPRLIAQREEILTMTNLFLIALHRPHIAIQPNSRNAAFNAVINVLNSQQRLFDITPIHHHKLYGLSFYTIDAGIFLSATTVMYPPSDYHLIQSIDQVLQQAIRRLCVISNRNHMARSGIEILRRCYKKVRGAIRFDNTISSTALLGNQASSQYDTSLYTNGPSLASTQSWETTYLGPGDTGVEFNFDESLWSDHIDQLLVASTRAPNFELIWDSFNGP